jgi:hypothetical protein
MPSCVNRGCGKSFDSSSNEECFFHPGGPVFHDALKGWSCCLKRVTDFDSFLKIPGCTSGYHSAVAISQVKVESPKCKPIQQEKQTIPLTAKEPVVNEPVKETFKIESLSAKVQEPQQEITRESDLSDAPESVIKLGDKCKRAGCGKPYISVASKQEDCYYHSGAPVFHEGSKGWSCCPRKVLEFDEFLKIKGCTVSKHRFTVGTTSSGPVYVECRRDWYQTPDKIIISLFAKNVDEYKTNIGFEEQKLKVDVQFQDGTVHKYYTDLFQPINPLQSAFKILSSKIEIVLKKANGISWAAINPKNVTSWTTFGLQGGIGGTVGSKEAIIAGDAPLHLLQ